MQDATFCMSIPWEPHHDGTLACTTLQKTTDVFTVSSPRCCFQAKIETRNGLRDVNKFVYKPSKWMTNSKVLAEA